MRHIRVASHVSLQPDLGRGGVGDGRGTRGGGGPKWHASVEPVFSLRACGARPSAKWPSDGEKAFRGQTGGRCEGRFSWGRASLARAGRFGLGELPTNGLHTSSF